MTATPTPPPTPTEPEHYKQNLHSGSSFARKARGAIRASERGPESEAPDRRIEAQVLATVSIASSLAFIAAHLSGAAHGEGGY